MSRTSPRTGVVEEFKSGFWTVRLDPPDYTEWEFLRPWQFRFTELALTDPRRKIEPGQKVELIYVVERNAGLWYAYPTTQQPAIPPATE